MEHDVELPAVKTLCTALEMAHALIAAWSALFGMHPPSRESIALLLGQWALETGRGRSMMCWNAGNVKSHEGDGHSFCFFACNEVLTPAQVAHYVAGAEPRTDGKPGPNAVATSPSVVWFYPSHPGCRFRAFHTIDEGAVDYLGLLNRRFAKAWPAVLAGDPTAFSHALKAQGYYTAPEASYTAGVVALFREMLRLDFAVNETPNHAEEVAAVDTLDDAERARVLNLVALTSFDLTRELSAEDEAKRSAEPDPSEHGWDADGRPA